MSFKELYSFTLDEEREVEKTSTRKNKKTGEETTVTKKVKETVPVVVKLKRPSRRQLEDAELEYSVEMSRCVKKGILTKAMLYKKYSDTGGVFSEDDAKDYGKLYKQILDLQNDYIRLDSVDKKSKDQTEELEKIKENLADTKRKIIEAESSMQSLFDHTADTKAQNRLLLWYTLMLTHVQKEEDEEPKQYFEGQDFEEKLDDYYLKEDENSDLYNKVIKKVSTILAFWFFNQASSPEEFNKLIEDVEKGEV
jgi:hypothetical protein|tara:strand:- start:6198 stop:6953 length:756 start_codon:yes stop_codon:yes gene_type:complete